MIYYAGHGVLDSTGTGFWIPVDAGTDRFDQRNWIPTIQIRNVIGKIQARHTALWADSCFSGDLLGANRGSIPEIDQAYFKNAFSRIARQVLTSGALEAVPDASEFSRQLKLALRGNREPYLDSLMLYGQIRLGITVTTPLFGSLKDSGHQEGGSFLLFLKEPGAKTAPATTAVAAAGSRPSTADLYVNTSVNGAEVFVDGLSRGKSPLLLNGLAAGTSIAVRARIGDLGASAEITLNPGLINELNLVLLQLKGNLLVVSPFKDLAVFIDGKDSGNLGSGLLRDLDPGRKTLELIGAGLYAKQTVRIEAEKTARVEVRLLEVGSLSLDFPRDALVQMGTGSTAMLIDSPQTLPNLPVGSHHLAWTIGGWSDKATITIEKGEIARYTIPAPSTLAITDIPINVDALVVGGKRIEIEGRKTVTIVDQRPDSTIAIAVVAGTSETLLFITTKSAETTALRLPSGRLAIDWFPPGSTGTLDSRPIALAAGLPGNGPQLLAKTYDLALAMPGIGTWTEQVEVKDGQDFRIDGHLAFARPVLEDQLKKTQSSLATRRTLGSVAWISAVAGAAGALASGLSWYLGQAAYDAYLHSTNPDATLAARQNVDLYHGLLLASAGVGGIGLGAGSIFAFLSSGQEKLNKAIGSLDEQLTELQRAELASIAHRNE